MNPETKDHTKKAEPRPVRELYPIPEAREILGDLSQATIYRLAAKNEIRLTKIGGRTFISAAEIARLTAPAA